MNSRVYKVLVANRGEIAIRIFRAAAELGWISVALYTEGDVSHAFYADETVLLESPARYMDAEYIANIARRTGCTHVHPGYGFLSESAQFALLFSDPSSHITFIGPSVDILKIASNKILSRELAASLGIPVAAGIRVSSVTDVTRFVNQLGSNPFPIIIKALDGGGGRGIRLVQSANSIEDAFQRCMGESASKQLFVERALVGPGWKHVEVQIVGDGREVRHLWDRECSVQRRFQKIIEIAPSTLPTTAVQHLLSAAVKMAKHLKYSSLGTFEFLWDAHTLQWVFLEINPRIQVEHTVTEEITGVDLVRIQLQLSLPDAVLASLLRETGLDPMPYRGHAIQLRLVAEDTQNSFQLSRGSVRSSNVSWPAGNGVRIDTWLSTGPYASDSHAEWMVGLDFDSLLAKIVLYARQPGQVRDKALRALKELRFPEELKTNVELLAGVLSHRDWESGAIHTQWLETNINEVLRLGQEHLLHRPHSAPLPPASHAGSLSSTEGDSITGVVLLQPGSSFQLSLGPSSHAQADVAEQKHSLVLSTIGHNAFPNELSGTIKSSLSPEPLAFSLTQLSSIATSVQVEFANPQDPTHLASPLAGKLVELHPALTNPSAEGLIREGETLLVVSVMKMESVVMTPKGGRVIRLGRGIEVGATIGEGTLVCVLSPADGGSLAKL